MANIEGGLKMSYFSINRNFWHLIIGFCTILLCVNSCTHTVREKLIVSPDILKQYVGNYQREFNFRERNPVLLMVALSGDHLIIQAMGREMIPVYAKSETKFAAMGIPVQIEFFKNDKGEVTHIIMDESGQRFKVPRIGR
jgi:hypothetical protein